jgi:protein O-mannosyl-transferase
MATWASLVGLGLAGSVGILRNQFVSDDTSIIVNNASVHSLAHPASFLQQPYWPKPYRPALYRPLATLGFAAQWAVGGGRPWPFRLISILLYLAVGLALYGLANRLAPGPAAWLVSALFLVHPVHVEAVAEAVNQSELMVGLMAVVMVLVYLEGRRAPRLGSARIAALVAGYLVAILFKESGLVLPLVLVAAEAVLVTDPRPLLNRWASVRLLFLMLTLGAAAAVGIRGLVLSGDLVGTPVAETLKGLSAGGRALTMLAIVPHWARLLFWPAHLRAEYSPSEVLPSAGWGVGELEGIAALILALALLVVAWRRNPVVAFGLLWMAIGLAPVSNVLVPTGVVVAERALFLPSLGAALVVAGLVGPLVTRIAVGRRRFAQVALAGAALGLLGLGATRNVSRQRVWRDELTFWRQATIDAPRSARAHHALAQLLFQRGEGPEAERQFQLAVAYATTDWAPAYDYARRLRATGHCAAAVPYYRKTVAIEPKHEAARSELVDCLLRDRRYADARRAAETALEHAGSPATAAVFRNLIGRAKAGADSMAADSVAAASPGPARAR